MKVQIEFVVPELGGHGMNHFVECMWTAIRNIFILAGVTEYEMKRDNVVAARSQP